jgi:hypothetical protein
MDIYCTTIIETVASSLMKAIALSERFWAKVQKTADCWLWTGCLDRRGYGKIRIDQENIRTTRVSWEFHFGKAPVGVCILQHCGNHACVRPDHLYVSSRHENEGRPRSPVEDRFWSKVKKTASCWLWTGYIDQRGYGKMWRFPQKAALVSRVSWELHNGPIPEGMNVLHRCDNPKCIRPSHLYLGTQSENMRDRWARTKR